MQISTKIYDEAHKLSQRVTAQEENFSNEIGNGMFENINIK